MDQDQLRQLESDFDVNDSATTKGGGAGKSTLTSRLTPAPQMVFRVSDPETARALGESLSMRGQPRIMRDADAGAVGARDANGVSFGAEVAVDRAASSSGSVLPAHLQRQFEGSLGADLSSVRVHTGSESAEAAHAVGAKAYTVGQDIHFAAGRYQPDDAFGMHLLAHEVAHTVQQSGGAQRRQNKLEVSAPQDAAEHEADRAADAMVVGLPATVSMVGGGAARQVQRDEDFPTLPEEMDKATTEAERGTRDAQSKPEYKPGSVLSNRYSQTEARDRLKKAQTQTATIESFATSGTDGVTWDMVNTNHATIDELSKYANMRDEEATDLGALVTGQKVLQQDFARVNAAVSTVQQSLGIKNTDLAKMATPENPVDHTSPLAADGQTGQKLGEAIGDGATLGDKETGKSSALAEMRVLTNNAISDYNKAVADVNSSSTGVKSASTGLKMATTALTLFNLKQENKDLTAELQAAQAEAKGVADSVSAVTGLVVACAGVTGGLATSLSGATTPGAGALPELKPSLDPALKAVDGKIGEVGLSTVNDLITKILLHTSGISAKIDRVTGALKKNEFEQLRAEKSKQGDAVKKAAQDLDKAVQDYKKAVADADAKKQTMRTALKDYGARLDKQSEKDGTGSGQRFEVVGKVMGECDAFIGQANLMWANIKSYKGSSSTAKDQRNSINEGVKGGNGRKYGLAVWWIESVPAANTFLVSCENIQLHMSGSEAGGKDDSVRPQDAVAKIEAEVKQAGSMAYGMRNQLAVYMGLNLAGTKPEFMG